MPYMYLPSDIKLLHKSFDRVNSHLGDAYELPYLTLEPSTPAPILLFITQSYTIYWSFLDFKGENFIY